MTQHVTLRTRTIAAGTVMELAGELDHHTAPQVRDALLGLALCPGQQLVIDLEGVTFCDSSGITVLIAARNHALAADAAIALAALPERLTRIIRMVGLDQVFPTHATAQDAEDAWRTVSD
ncbi:STAS domain-containing protein [Streptomyces cyaneofuscatus]|uniref:STAS domain-containing protein n=1 Tax=Streptomyces cyaneofuscatus TaxID=66883 RepID=UPI00367FFDD5